MENSSYALGTDGGVCALTGLCAETGLCTVGALSGVCAETGLGELNTGVAVGEALLLVEGDADGEAELVGVDDDAGLFVADGVERFSCSPGTSRTSMAFATPAPPTAMRPSPSALADPTMIQVFFFMAAASCWLPSRGFVSVVQAS